MLEIPWLAKKLLVLVKASTISLYFVTSSVVKIPDSLFIRDK
jgi:hypothetical protein